MSDVPNLIEFIASAIDLLGVIMIIISTTLAMGKFIFWRMVGNSTSSRFDTFKGHMGRGLLIGLEILLAADIIKTVALEPTFSSLSALGLLVLIRTFLSWTLTLEVEGRWPWQARADNTSSP